MLGYDRSKSRAIREWIVFSLCLGIGAHIVLGLILHSPELWPLKSIWVYGLLISFSVYVIVQLGRSLWWWLRGVSDSDTGNVISDD
jgi:hypothetical protein